MSSQYVKIKLRRDTAAEWSLKNPVLSLGEPGVETNTRKIKIGDGVKTWNQLNYVAGADDNPILVNTNEVIDDRIANLLVPGANITMQYDDTANLLLIGTSGLQPSGNYATLINGTIPSAQLPSYVDDVLEYNNLASFPASGESNKIYVAVDTKIIYRWSGSTYVEISPSPGSTDSVPEGVLNKYYTDSRASAAAPVQSVAGKTGVVVLNKSDVGLGNVDNTSDASKPISTATQTALDGKAPTRHVHGNIDPFGGVSIVIAPASVGGPVVFSNAGGGLVGRGAFGTQAGDVCQGNDPRLADSREWTAATVSQADAEAGTSTSRFAFTPQRIFQAVAAAAPVQSVAGKTGVVVLNKSDVGLGNVDNTSDANKPVSTATQNALDAKAPIASPTFTGTVGGISKNMVGLGNVDNTSDADKPISSATQTALNLYRKIQNITLGFSVPSAITAEKNTEYVFNTNNLIGPIVVGNFVINDPPSASLGDAYIVNKPSGTMHNVVIGGVTYDKASKFYIYRHYSLNGVIFSWQTRFYSSVDSVAGKTGVVTLTKEDVGLGNVDNTSDANKPVSTATQNALNDKANSSHTHDDRYYTESEVDTFLAGKQASGSYATLTDGKVPSLQLPSYVDDVIEAANLAALPVSGETSKIYVTLDSNKTYRWSGSAYVEISASPGSTDSVPEGSVNKYYTDARASAAAPVQSVNGLTGVVTIPTGPINQIGNANTNFTAETSAGKAVVRTTEQSTITFTQSPSPCRSDRYVGYVPIGSTFVFNGQTYTVTYNDRTPDCGGFIVVEPEIDLWTIPDGSYPLTIPRTFEFQDGTITLPAEGGEIQYPDGTTQNSANLTGGVTFSGVQIIGSGDDSGDGNGYSTLELVPDADLTGNHQYLIIDPTGPNHIHIRAGGEQDESNAELILGGEIANVSVLDYNHTVKVRTSTTETQMEFTPVWGGFSGFFIINSWQPAPPVGSTFVADGTTFTVTSVFLSPIDPTWDCTYTPANGSFATGNGETYTAVLAASPKEWTFEDGGILDLAGGIRFPDNSVQNTAGFVANYYLDEEPASFPGQVEISRTIGTSGIEFSRRRFGRGAANLSAALLPDNANGAEGTLSLSFENTSDNTTGTLTISPRTGISFPDGSTQTSAGVQTNTGLVPNSVTITNMVSISQANYDAIETKDPNTLYIINS
jgi:hypothetical protein